MPGRSLDPDAGRGETQAHRLDQVGHRDGDAAQPCKTGGSGLKVRSKATESRIESAKDE
jgi:hypothetical protein